MLYFIINLFNENSDSLPCTFVPCFHFQNLENNSNFNINWKSSISFFYSFGLKRSTTMHLTKMSKWMESMSSRFKMHSNSSRLLKEMWNKTNMLVVMSKQIRRFSSYKCCQMCSQKWLFKSTISCLNLWLLNLYEKILLIRSFLMFSR